jgi:hypothetical protein
MRSCDSGSQMVARWLVRNSVDYIGSWSQAQLILVWFRTSCYVWQRVIFVCVYTIRGTDIPYVFTFTTCFRPDVAIFRYIRSHTAPRAGTNTRNTTTGHGNIDITPTHPRTNRNNSEEYKKKPYGKNTHISIRQQELAKGSRQQKEEKYILLAPT